mmetsp:Transcript_20880/g.83218  ORF Transcript_20880/g.83218 Transcript_20880/m.83218 type:complete len:267 (+) Transcript_20880:688-1488(+)
MAALFAHQRDGRPAALQRRRHRLQDARPLPTLVGALPALVEAPRRHLGRRHLPRRRRDRRGVVALRPDGGLPLVRRAVPVDQLLARPLHVAPAHLARRPALRRRRVDLGPRRALHDRPTLRRALWLLRLDAPPHRLDPRLPPPLLQPPVLQRRRGDQAPQSLPRAQGPLQLRPARHHRRDLGLRHAMPLRRGCDGRPVPQVHLPARRRQEDKVDAAPSSCWARVVSSSSVCCPPPSRADGQLPGGGGGGGGSPVCSAYHVFSKFLR